MLCKRIIIILILIWSILIVLPTVRSITYQNVSDVYTGFTWDNYKDYSKLWNWFNGNMYYANGDVGINTTTPQNTLNVIGDGNFTGNLYGGTVYSGGSAVLTSFTETDPLWTANQSSYFTKSDILGFSYYNLTSFDIADYYLKDNPFAFINTTTASNLNYLILSKWANITDAPTNLSFFTDDLGDRGYTHLTNFTDDILWTTGFNATGDARWLGVGDESDPLWTGNWTNVAFINKANAFGAFNQSFNTNVLFVDSNSERIGIGTTTPQNELNVIGDANVTGTLYAGAISGEAELNTNSSDYWDALDTPADITGLIDSQISDDLTANYSKLVDLPTNIDEDSTDDLTTSTSWSGDLSGTGSSPTVDDDSHAHTKATITIAGENITSGTINNARISLTESEIPSLTSTWAGTLDAERITDTTDLNNLLTLDWANITNKVPSDFNYKILLKEANITDENWIEDSQESSLNVNSSDYWDGYDTPSGWDLDSSDDITTANIGSQTVNKSDYWDNLNTESDLTPSNFLTAGSHLSYSGDTLNVADDWWDADGDIDADEISESKIAFSTPCAAGNHYYLNGNDLACEADDDTTYSASGTLLNLTGTTFSVNEGTLTDTKGCKYVSGTGIVCDQTYLTSYTETDPKWTGNQSSYYNKTYVYNTTEIDDFSLSHWTDDLGDRGYTHLTNFTDNLGNRGYSHLTNFTDDLGDRGYTHLTNFTDDILWTSGFNATGDSRWLTSYTETDPKWTGNWTSRTGTGNVVFSASPTIVTPTIASFTNAQHNHENAAGGGTISITAATTGTLTVARGGTGTTSLTSNNLLVGAGTSAVNFLAPGTTGQVVRSTGTAWASAQLGFSDISGTITDAQHGNRGGGALHSVATTGAHGFMSSTDKTKLDGVASGAQPGTVTSISQGTGMNFSTTPITTTGTINLANTAVTPGSYGSNIAVGTFTVDQQGRLTAGGSTTIRSGTTAQTGVVQLTNSVSSTSTTTAAVPANVKTAYDTAVAKASPGSCTGSNVVQTTTTGGVTCYAVPQGTVTSVTGTAPIVSSGGTTPAISATILKDAVATAPLLVNGVAAVNDVFLGADSDLTFSMPAATASVHGYMTSTFASKLNGIEAGATADQTATEILTAIKTVDGSGSGLDADLLDGFDGTKYIPRNAYSYANGFLIATDIPAASNTMFMLEIKGNSYGAAKPIDIKVQGYNYNDGNAIIQTSATAVDWKRDISAFNYNGYLYFWLNQSTSFQSLSVVCRSTMDTASRNRVTDITNAVKPTSGVTREVTITPKQVWNSGNDGTGSGLDADLLDGSEKTAFQMDVSDSCSGENVIQTIAQDGTTGCYNTYSAADDLIDDITEWQGACTNCVTDGDVVDTITASNYVRKSTWTDIDNYPTGCGAGTAVRIIGDTLTCIDVYDAADDPISSIAEWQGLCNDCVEASDIGDILDASHITDIYVFTGGDTMTGDLTVGSTGRTANTYVRSLAGDAYIAGFEAYGASQGTGYFYAGQSTSHGGGMFYNGDGTPAFATGESADRISFYRNNAGTKEVVFSYSYSGNDVAFRGGLSVAGTFDPNGAVTLPTTGISGAGAGSGLDADKLDGYHGASASTANTYALRDASGDINTRLFRSEYDTTNANANYIMTQIDTATNNYIRPTTKAQLIASLNLMTKAGGTFTGAVVAADHGAASSDQVVNVVYTTTTCPADPSTTTIGTLCIKYTA